MGGAWAQHDSNHGWIDGVAVVDVFVVSVFFIYICVLYTSDAADE